MILRRPHQSEDSSKIPQKINKDNLELAKSFLQIIRFVIPFDQTCL